MHEPSDGIAEEVERQLQLALAAAAIAARRAIAARGQALEQARRDSDQAARAAQARIDAERLLATERLRPVFDDAWWETAGPREIADMWEDANSWRDPDPSAAEPTIFDQAAHRIRGEVRDRSGLDPTQVVALAAVQELELEHQATLAQPSGQQSDAAAAAQDAPRRVRRPAAARAAPRPSRHCGCARACHRGENARRSRPSPRGRGGGTHSRRGRSGAATRRRQTLATRAHAPPVSSGTWAVANRVPARLALRGR